MTYRSIKVLSLFLFWRIMGFVFLQHKQLFWAFKNPVGVTLVVRFDLQKQQYAAKYIGEIIHITLVSFDGKNVDQISYNMLHQILEVCFLFKNYHSLSYTPFLSSLYYLNIQWISQFKMNIFVYELHWPVDPQTKSPVHKIMDSFLTTNII